MISLSQLWRAAVAVLLFLFCYRLWHIGINHTDDATWFLAARKHDVTVIRDFAVHQGRIWALVAGTFMYTALYFTGSVTGELIKFGSLVVFFLLFYRVIALYFGERVALLAAVLNLALFALRWEGSIVVCYPALFWVTGAMGLYAILLGRSFILSHKARHLYSCLALLFLSLFTQEGSSVLMAVLFLLSIFGNYYLLESRPFLASLQRCFSTPEGRNLTERSVAVIGIYFSLYFIWRLAFPSVYSGNTLGHSQLSHILPTLLRYSTGGSIICDVFVPYSITFSDVVNRDGIPVTYFVYSYIKAATYDGVAVVYGLAIFSLLFSLLSAPCKGIPRLLSGRRAFAGIAVGFMIAVLPVLPVAMTEKYQRWYYDLGVSAYAFTALSHFGVTLGLACIALWLCKYEKPQILGIIYAGSVAAPLAILALGGYAMNNDIANDMRVESNRWKAVDSAMKMASGAWNGMNALYAPRLASGSWFAAVDKRYWADYIHAVYHRNVSVWTNAPPQAIRKGNPVVFMDYQLGDNQNQLIVFAAPLSALPDRRMVATSIAVFIDHPTASDYQQYILSFKDKARGEVAIRFEMMQGLGGLRSTRIINGIQAIPSSIRIQRHSTIFPLPVGCGKTITGGITVLFGTVFSDDGTTCDGGAFLDTGWNGREAAGVWSKSREATLAVPTGGLPRGDILMRFTLGSYAGLGYAEGTQRVFVSAQGRVLAVRTDRKGAGLQPLEVAIPANLWLPGQDLVLTVGTDRIFNPAKIHANPDTRDLGIYINSMEISHLR